MQSSNHNRLRVQLGLTVSKEEKGVILVGHHSDAFQVTQCFTIPAMRGEAAGYGLREMAELSLRSSRLPPCQCDKPQRGLLTLTSQHCTSSAYKLSLLGKGFEAKDDLVQNPVQPDSADYSSRPPHLSRIFAWTDGTKSFVYVSDNLAERWLQLQLLCYYSSASNEGAIEYHVALGGQHTCVDCAIRNSELMLPNGVFLL